MKCPPCSGACTEGRTCPASHAATGQLLARIAFGLQLISPALVLALAWAAAMGLVYIRFFT